MPRVAWKLAFGSVIWVFASILQASVVTISDVQPMIDWPGPGGLPTNPAELTFALFDYSTQPKLSDLTAIDFSLSLQCAATMPDDIDFNNLTLGLDGIDTGIKLNGFSATDVNSLLFHVDAGETGFPTNEIAGQLLNRLNDDHQLFASVFDSTPGATNLKMYSAFDTTLMLSGSVSSSDHGTTTPEPISALIWSAATAVLLTRGYRQRTKRRTINISNN